VTIKMSNLSDNNQNEIIQHGPHALAHRSASLAQRGLELISQLSARILHVPLDYETLEEAIKASSDGGIIEIAPGEYQCTVRIDKSITLRGTEEGVTILPTPTTQVINSIMVFPSDVAPIFEIDNIGEVIIKNVKLRGYDAIYYPSALEIKKGKVTITDCDIENFAISFDTWSYLDDNYSYDMIFECMDRPTLLISGAESEIEISNSTFNKCGNCLEAENIRGASIRNCSFDLSYERNGIILTNSSALLENNRFTYGHPFWLLKGSNVSSNFDTYSEVELLNCESTFEASFNHATIKATNMLTITFGVSPSVEVDSSGNLMWQKPKITVGDSIVCLKFSQSGWRYGSRPRDYPFPNEVNLFESGILLLEKNNLVISSPDYSDEDPQFGLEEGNYLTLLPTSPALKAASDGSNLGAWQGPQ
jgi:hypothetical protein